MPTALMCLWTIYREAIHYQYGQLDQTHEGSWTTYTKYIIYVNNSCLPVPLPTTQSNHKNILKNKWWIWKTVLGMTIYIVFSSRYLINLTFNKLLEYETPIHLYSGSLHNSQRSTYQEISLFKIGSVGSIEIRCEQIFTMKYWYVNRFCI